MQKIIVFTVLITILSTGSFSQSKVVNQINTSNMINKDFTASIVVSQSPEIAFDAIQNFRAWWSEEIEGKTNQLNETFFYHFQDVHLCKIKLIEVVPNKKLVYQVVDNQFNFVKDKTEWIGTKLIFEISEEAGKTKIIFTHEGLTPAYECYSVCEDAWTSYIKGSLQSLITTGKGKPNAKEGGLNAELIEKWGLPNKSNTMTQEKSFSTSIVVDKSAAEVFAAVNNVRGWWQGEIKGNTEKLGDEFTYQMKDVHFTKQKIVELVPNRKVVWLVTDSRINFVANKSEWVNTKIEFDITQEGDKTKLTFTHIGLVPSIECYGGCSGAWGQLVEKSLFSFITTGKGVDVF